MSDLRQDDLVRIRPWADLFFISQDRTVLATERDGFFDGGPYRGLFVHQTRLLSRYRLTIDGKPPKPVALSNVSQHRWLGYYVALPPGQEPGGRDEGSGHMEELSERTLEIRVDRVAGGGLREEIELTNYSLEPTAFTLEIELDADFADQGETLSGERRQEGEIAKRWSEVDRELAFDYRAEHGSASIDRGIRIRVEAPGTPSYQEGRLAFQVELAPQESWRARLVFVPVLRDLEGAEPLPPQEYDRRRETFLSRAASFATRESETLAPVVIHALEQAKRDLAVLRLHDPGETEDAWTLAAGLPLYIALFGRDTLTASWQAAMLGPEMMDGTLRALARLQGRREDDWRDEQPGRMLHEAHTGPLAALGYIPQRRYYGSVTTSGFYPLVAAELWHWTGDKERVRPFLGPALDGLRWLERYSDRDHDGFFEYKTRSRQGVVHQGWKDSANAIVDEDGAPVPPPIATCEEQAFVYVARLHLSEVLWWMGEKDEARRLFHAAGELKKRFNDAFWMEDKGFFAMGLDASGRQIRAIGSNAGHCLAAGIVDDALVERTAARLLADDLWTGWGIRTLSARNPAFNPYSYHRGSVWPVEHGSFVLGFLRYGLHDALEKVCRGQLEAARLFDACRLPEVFSGHARGAGHPFPALYPQTNAPQAWSASAVLCMVQSLLGLYPYAPLRLLLVDPRLPDWLPEITVRNLRVGEATVTIRFFREGEKSGYEVLDQRGRLHVLRQPSPWSLTAGFAERLRDVLASLLPASL
ncbi:MAG TPA: glycogen debranching N-terminal domain-containing protein [Thermoanaerobaculia bacterium]